jgi:DNA-binding transcriptional ArsR family regulator
MVKYQDPTLDRTFGALADPTRRALIARLGEGRGVSVSELARPFPVSLPAIMKHLDVLSDAGLIVRTKTGRTVTCELSAAVMKSALDWLNRYERFWNEQLNRLEAYLEEDESCPPQQPPSQASPSSAGSKRRPPKSSRRGPIRKN